MKFRFVFTKSAIKDIDKLGLMVRKKVLKKLNLIEKSSDYLYGAKKLKGLGLNTFRYRIGDYRIIFRVDKKITPVILVVMRVGHRKNIY